MSPLAVAFACRDFAWGRPLRMELRRRGADVTCVRTWTELSAHLDARAPDLVVIEDDVDHIPRLTLGVLVHRRAPSSRVLILTPESGPETDPAVPGVRALAKPHESRALGTILEALFPDRLGAATATRRPIVLCVDDDDFYLSALRRILGRHGYRVLTFADADSALDALGRLKPDLAILDLRLPGMDGLDLADEMRRECGDRLPIVMLTGRGTDRDVSEGYRHGASYYITKPCSPRTVVNVVDYLVGDLDPQERTVLETQL